MGVNCGLQGQLSVCISKFSLEGLQPEHHGFSDASDAAYAGVVYLRAVCTDSTISTTLLMAKTKVAPISGSTTSRLELCGAQLLSKIMCTVANALSISTSDLYAWSDSTVVLCCCLPHQSS